MNSAAAKSQSTPAKVGAKITKGADGRLAIRALGVSVPSVST